MTFDMEGTFGDDYLYFYEESIDDAHSDADTAEILGLLDLPPGARILDAPCGHGRIARRLAAAGMEVTGVDLTPAYLEQARADPSLPPHAVTYLEGDVRGPPGRRAVRRRGVLAELVRLLRRRRLPPGPRGVPPSPAARAGRWRSTPCTTTEASATSPRHPTPWSSSTVTTPWSRSRPSTRVGAGW